MKESIKILLLLILAGSNVSAQVISKLNVYSKRIDTLAARMQWANDVPGLSVGVIIGDQVVFKKSYGVQNLQTKKNLTAASDFHMASVSKPFAATAILQLVESGKLHLDTPIVRYLPYFEMSDIRFKEITLYHILTHSSGIPDVTDYEWGRPYSRDDAAESYSKSFTEKSLDFEPGTQFNYSNAAYNILADIIAKVSGVSFEQYTQRHIFLPLGMNKSSFLLKDIESKRRTAPHVIGHDLDMVVSAVYPYNRIHAPSSTLHSNLGDMLKWAQVFLNRGTLGRQSLITTGTWSNMTQSRLKVNEQFDVCLSWFKVMIGSKNVYFHSGGDTGFRTFVGFEPESKTAVVLMGNNDLFDATEPAFAIFNTILADTIVEFKKPIYMDLKTYILKDGIDATKRAYYGISKTEPNRYKLGADNVIPLASWLYDRGYKQEAIDVLIFCTELEPSVAKWYEHVGDVYSAWENAEKALFWFKKALAIDPSGEELKEKIKRLSPDK